MSEKISVLMPVYNREKYIRYAIWSIIFQSYENLELVIFDDGSTDGTPTVIERYIMEDSRVRLIRGEKNQGVPYARNKLLDACQTRIACWQDSDDMSNINRLWVQHEAMNQFWLTLGRYKIYKADFEKKVIDSGLWRGTTKVNGEDKRGCATLMFWVDKTIRFNEDLKLGGEDNDWLDRMETKYGKPKMLKDLIYYIRFHNDRIGVWKRKIKRFDPAMSYEEILRAYR